MDPPVRRRRLLFIGPLLTIEALDFCAYVASRSVFVFKFLHTYLVFDCGA